MLDESERGEVFEQAASLIADVWSHNGAGSEMHIGDLAWGTFRRWPSAYGSLRLWPGDAQPTQALTMFDGVGVCDLVVRPGEAGLEAADLALDWAEARCREVAAGAKHAEFRVGRRLHGTALRRLLDDRGFLPRSGGAPAMSRMIATGDIDEPVLPDGFRVRELLEGDLAQRVDTFKEAFPGDELGVDAYKALRGCSLFRPRLDVVAIDPSNSIAAFATLWLDVQNAVVQIEPAGCHPDHRRLGLTRAVIHHALRVAVELGANEALVRHNSDNFSARALYESCGFSTACDHVGLSKTLDCMNAR